MDNKSLVTVPKEGRRHGAHAPSPYIAGVGTIYCLPSNLGSCLPPPPQDSPAIVSCACANNASMCASLTLYGVKERLGSQETVDANVNPSCGRLLPLVEESPTGSLPSRRPCPAVAPTPTMLPAQAVPQFRWSPGIDEGRVEGVWHPGGVRLRSVRLESSSPRTPIGDA
jgi:hypothetical protein